MLVAMADHAAIAVQSAQEASAAARHRAALEQLLAVSSRLTETFSIDAILQSVCDGDPHGARVRERVHRPARARHGRVPVAGDARLEHGRRGGGDADDAARARAAPAAGVRGRGLLPGRARRGDAAGRPRARHVPLAHQRHAARTAWRNHWLLVPLWSRSGGLMGVDLGGRPGRPHDPGRRASCRRCASSRTRRRRRSTPPPSTRRCSSSPSTTRSPASTTGGRSASGSSASRPGRCATATRCRSCCAT